MRSSILNSFSFGRVRILVLPAIILLTMILIGSVSPSSSASTSAINVILFVGDGMGAEHVVAGGVFANGAPGTLSFESFPYSATMTHNNALDQTTDSAAAGTAMATGVKVANGVISMALPGDGRELPTLLELHQAENKRTGLVTTSFMTDATPAAFGAHEASRDNRSQIAEDFLTQTRPNVLFGGGSFGFNQTRALNAGYELVTDLSSLQAVETETTLYLAGSFGLGELPPAGTPGRSASLPTLPEMTESALALLDSGPDGFFLLVEHEGIDTASHSNDETALVRAVGEFSDAVQVAVDWMATNPNTIILVAADHETGGLTVNEPNPQAGVVPRVTWSTFSHTQTAVPLYAIGTGMEQINGTQMDISDIFELLRPERYDPSPTPSPTSTPTSTASPMLPPTPTASPTPPATPVPPSIYKEKILIPLLIR